MPAVQNALLAARLPTLIRGVFWEGWQPSGLPLHYRDPVEFAERIRRRAGLVDDTDAWRVTEAVAKVLRRHVDSEQIEEIVRASAEEAADLDVAVALSCSCAGTDSSCTTSCGSGAAPSVFVSLSAERDFSGLLISNLSLRSESRVQIR